MTTKRRRAPREARTKVQLQRIPRDYVTTPEFWMLADIDCVTIAKGVFGGTCEEMVTLPRHEFDRLIDWYNTGSWTEDV